MNAQALYQRINRKPDKRTGKRRQNKEQFEEQAIEAVQRVPGLHERFMNWLLEIEKG